MKIKKIEQFIEFLLFNFSAMLIYYGIQLLKNLNIIIEEEKEVEAR